MTSIIDRYVAATNDGFPDAERTDIEREVRTAFLDMTEARIALGMDPEQAEREAAEELGDPRLFARQFRQNPRYLIGPELFDSWWSTLRLVVAIVVPIVVAAGVLGMMVSDDPSPANAIGILASGLGAAAQGAFWVTITFVALQYFGASPNWPKTSSQAIWTVDQLPETTVGRQIGLADLVTNMLGLGLFAMVLIQFAARGLGAFGISKWLNVSDDTPAFNPQTSTFWLWFFLALITVNAIVVLWSYIVGHWTNAVMWTTVAVNVVWMISLLVLKSEGRIFNPTERIPNPERQVWIGNGERFEAVFVAVMIVICLWDIWEAVRGHWSFKASVSSNP